MMNYRNFNEKDLYAFISILGSEENTLPSHLWEELKSFCEDRSEWSWNTFEKIYSFMNNWINQYNKSLSEPVLVSVSALLKGKDRTFYALSDGCFAGIIANNEIVFVGQRIMQHHSETVFAKKEILLPQNLLGGFESLPSHIYDEVINGYVIIFPHGVNVHEVRTLFEESSCDFDSFCNLLSDNNIKFIGGR